jgi:two-component system nitrate/nitrite response regulator NarL
VERWQPGAHVAEEIRIGVGIREAGVMVVKKLSRVMVVSDVRLFRDGMVAMLARTGRVEIIAIDGEPDRASSEPHLAPDVVLIDVGSLNSPGAASVLGSATRAKVIAFGVSNTEHEILACANAGVSSLIEKDGTAEDVLVTIEAVARGESPCPARFAGTLFQCLSAMVKWQTHRRHVEGFSVRELEVAEYLERGWSNKKIARQLDISAATVKNHVHNILEKLQVHRRGEVAAAMRKFAAASARSIIRHWSVLPALIQLQTVYPF